MRVKLSKDDVAKLDEINKSVSELSSDKNSSISSQENGETINVIVEDLAEENKASNDKLEVKYSSRKSIPYEITFVSEEEDVDKEDSKSSSSQAPSRLKRERAPAICIDRFD